MSRSEKGPPPPLPPKSGKCSSVRSTKIMSTSTSTCSTKLALKELDIKQRPKAMLTRMVYDWEWEIPNFDMAFPLPGPLIKVSVPTLRTLRSEKVIVGEEINKKSEWQFQLSQLEGWVRWHMCLTKISRSAEVPYFFTLELKLSDRNGKELLSSKTANVKTFGLGEFGWNDLIEMQKLWDQKDLFLQDNMLRMQITMELFRDHSKSVDVALKQKMSEFSLLMTQDMVKLRGTESSADVNIECKGKVFPVHRLILSARSKAFAKMFDNQVTCKSLVLDDLESYVLEPLLEYIYTGAVNSKYMQNNQMLSGLIRAADKYDLNELKSFCFSAMAKVINADNVGELAVLAYRHNADQSVKKDIEIFCRGNLENLLKLKSFRCALKQEPDAFFSDEHCGDLL